MQDRKACPRCGTELLLDAVVCFNCGYRYRPPSSGKFAVMMLAAGSILFGAFGGPYFEDIFGLPPDEPLVGILLYGLFIFILPAVLFYNAQRMR